MVSFVLVQQKPFLDRSCVRTYEWCVGQALATDWVDHPYSLILDVDCTTPKKTASSFCKKKFGVYDYPTLKYGHPHALQEYQGPRSYSVLKQFAQEVLTGFQCIPSQPTACTTPEQRSWLQQYQQLSQVELETTMHEIKNNLTLQKQTFQKQVDHLQKEYQEMVETKARRIQELEQGDLRYMLAIQKARTKGINGPSNDKSVSGTNGHKEEL